MHDVNAARDHGDAADDPNYADAQAMRADMFVMHGRPKSAIEAFASVLRLNPGWYYWMQGQALYAAGQYEAAANALRKPETIALRRGGFSQQALPSSDALKRLATKPNFWPAPTFHHRQVSRRSTFEHAPTLVNFIEGYRKGGLPN